MKLLSFPLAAAFAALLSLSACGGGSGGGTDGSTTTPAPAITIAAESLGTGAEAVTGKKATVTYSGWLYSAGASGNKGTKFDSGSFSFTLGAKQVIDGFDKGVLGMKVGGKRTVVIPAALGYGASGAKDSLGNTIIPPNADLVFDIELTAVQ